MPKPKTKLKKLEKKLNNFILNNQAEVKSYPIFNTLTGDTQVGPLGTSIRLSQPSTAVAGTDVGRIGDEIQMKAIRFAVDMYLTNTSTPFQRARVIIGYDKMYAGTVITNAELFASTSATTGTYANFNSAFNPAYVNIKGISSGKRMDIWYDKTVLFGNTLAVGGMGTAPPVSQRLVFKKHFKRPKLLTYDSSLGATNTAGRQLFAFLFIGNSTTANQNPVYFYHGDIYYTDS